MSRKAEISMYAEVKLPNVSTLGYGQWKAKGGDVIVYKEHYTDGDYRYRQARVIGKITRCPADGLEDCTGHLLVIAFADDLSFGYERWVDPKDVVECKRPEHALTFMDFALRASLEDLHKYVGESDIAVRERATYWPHREEGKEKP